MEPRRVGGGILSAVCAIGAALVPDALKTAPSTVHGTVYVGLAIAFLIGIALIFWPTSKRVSPGPRAVGQDAVVIGDAAGRSVGDRSVVIGATDDRGNTVIRGGTAVGYGATADSTSVAIGSGASAGDASAVMSLPEAIRYLVEESAWTKTLADDDDHLLDKIAVELKDRLERGIPARGRRVIKGVAGYQRGPENIPTAFWPGAWVDCQEALIKASAPSVASDEEDIWADIQLNGHAVKRVWLPLAPGEEPTNTFALAMRKYRLTGVLT